MTWYLEKGQIIKMYKFCVLGVKCTPLKVSGTLENNMYSLCLLNTSGRSFETYVCQIHFKNFSEVKNYVFDTNTSKELSAHVRKALGCIIIRLF